MNTIKVHKADGVSGSDDVESVLIEISQEIPTARYVAMVDSIFMNDAERIASALKSLPGGTLGRLIGLLMIERASQFVVPLFDRPVSIVVTSERIG